MEEIDYNDDSKEGKLRRWVSNLQLESWQLELLITGFSIFLLASGYDEYERFRSTVNFDKFVRVSDSSILFIAAGKFILSTLPIAIKFFLISLLLHLLLRGFWIGIVGLSSVSNKIDFEMLNLKGSFRRYLPQRVKTLDDLIFHVDQISSVIFAYTYLLVFSLLSVVIVASFIFAIMGLTIVIPQSFGDIAVSGMLMLTVGIVVVMLTLGAIIFFLDSLFFSAFKKSKWFSGIYFPVYRLFSIISLAFIYRSIYYHLITNFKKKHIIGVSAVLILFYFLSSQFSSWNRYLFFPSSSVKNEYLLKTGYYDDERGEDYIYSASIPSKIVSESFMPLFIRYSPQNNFTFNFFCPESEALHDGISIKEGIEMGIQSQSDTANTVSELMVGGGLTRDQLGASLDCIQSVYQVTLDNEVIPLDFVFTFHANRKEKGFLQMLDLNGLSRGKHIINIKQQEYQGNVLGEIKKERFKLVDLVEIVFWKG